MSNGDGLLPPEGIQLPVDGDFITNLLDGIHTAGALTGNTPALVLVLQLEDDPCLFQLTREPADFARLAEYVSRDSVMALVMEALEAFAAEHLVEADILPYISAARAIVVRLELMPRLHAIATELKRFDSDLVDVPLTLTLGTIEAVEDLLAREDGLATDDGDEGDYGFIPVPALEECGRRILWQHFDQELEIRKRIAHALVEIDADDVNSARVLLEGLLTDLDAAAVSGEESQS